ncbi:MAG: UDP-N-acetylenolpyruvoylglucosamine reductase [Balneola sp.]|jgi:UDP-N-acetylmuramate dehydrogenase|nr:UDP-N-acetylenolpyruvoylglucosamine reductase [Balneola sp.]MBE79312.1 UDP-N-acetylenolpyruvoylglucosamine reductase [Balneola sp.]HBX66964.1 UDP-N-acetylenolpyruvoylglucosamine reductase [Balneolaceae bacterium]|tara:strand:+ start:2683 stop:3711 length:1029 start_codon:yes stop_codon:yes gene_type:complete
MSNLPSIREHVDISSYNTMGIAAKARYFVSVSSTEELRSVIADSELKNLDKFVLGGGSNVLFVDDFDGLIIQMDMKGKNVVEENADSILLKIGAGENWHELVMYCVEKGWGGIENLSLIPGSVGAAPIQNIGAYGVELEEVFEELTAVQVETGEERIFSKAECAFGYRDSIFKNKEKGNYIITHLTLRLQKSPSVNTSYRALSEKLAEEGITNPGIQDISKAVIEIRQSKLPDPAEIGNTGSFFKNPVLPKSEFEELQKNHPDIPHYPSGEDVKVPAAWLIDQCGWKGKRFGDAGVHKMQALVIVNYGNATGNDIWSLATRIQKSVKETFGVALTPEVNIVG